MGYSISSSEREVYRNTILPQETRKALNRQPNLHLEQLEKGEVTTDNADLQRIVRDYYEQLQGDPTHPF